MYENALCSKLSSKVERLGLFMMDGCEGSVHADRCRMGFGHIILSLYLEDSIYLPEPSLFLNRRT